MAIKSKWFYFWYYHRRWSIYLGHYGWHICTPVLAVGWSNYTNNGINFETRKFMWGFWPAPYVEGEKLYKYGSK